MRWACWIAGLAVCLEGCAPTAQERVHDYNEDGVYLFQAGNYEGARDTFKAAVALQPEDPGLLYNLGECYDRLGNTAKAGELYQACLQRAPNHASCRHALAAMLMRDGHRPEATRMVEDWITREPKLATAYAEDGWLWHECGDLPRAQARLQQALELDPHDNRALTELARVYEAMQRPDRAVVLYERALENHPGQPDIITRVNLLKSQGASRPQPE
jgi:tetratricopeptide (TPR) repeat protein